MKNYTITVNGNVYDVVVEEGASTGAPVAEMCIRDSSSLPHAVKPKMQVIIHTKLKNFFIL